MVQFQQGTATDLTTEPATRVFTLIVQNAGHVPAVLAQMGFIFWNGEDFQALSYAHETGSKLHPFPKFPHELQPRTQMEINMELMDVVRFVKEHQSNEFPEVALFVTDRIWESFETERMPFAEFIGQLEELEEGSHVDEANPHLAEIRAVVRQGGLGGVTERRAAHQGWIETTSGCG